MNRLLISVALVVVEGLAIAPAIAETCWAFRLPDTDQRDCYQLGPPYAKGPCAGTGQDGAYVQNPLSYTDHGDGSVTDNNTGLIWQKNDDGILYNWYEATGVYDATYNPTGIDACGSFGRLPSRSELTTIVDYALPDPGPSIHPVFAGAKASRYWSSSPYAGSPPAGAWGVAFGDGHVYPLYKYAGLYVRCVRGGLAPVPVLADNGNGTVTDSRSGRVWQQGEAGQMGWSAALAYCEGLRLAGSTTWRLPNVRELGSLIDDTRRSPAIDTSIFANAASSNYWASTSYAGNSYLAWIVNFDDGWVSIEYKYEPRRVRCVRGEPLIETSVGASDGWILEATESSGKGGTLSAVATIRIGDDAADRQYRGILSFNTSAIPDDAVITGATLRLKKEATVGTNPFRTHGFLYADVMQGAFSGQKTLDLSDFGAAATGTTAVRIPAALAAGWYRATLGEEAIGAINKSGVTQFRLRFAKDDNDDRGADYLSIYSGDAPAANRPALVVRYEVP